MRVRLPAIFALLVFGLAASARPAQAAELVPGDACGTGNLVANVWQMAGGKENSGVTNGMFCDGAHWKGVINFQSTGKVAIGNTAPGSLLDIGKAGTTLGTMRLEGNTSGYVQLQPAPAAGSWTMTLPNGAGMSGYVLKTNGSGVTSWTASTSAPAGSSTNVQFNSGGALGGNSGFVYTGGYVGIGTTTPSAPLGLAGTADFNDGNGSLVISNNETPCTPASFSIILGGYATATGNCDVDVSVVIGNGAYTLGGSNDYWQTVIGDGAGVASPQPKNVVLGTNAFSGASDNVVIGFQATAIYPPINDHGNSVAIGLSAFAGGTYSVTVGPSAATGNPYSVAIGAYALASEGTGSQGFDNTAIGPAALANDTTGDGNVGVGDSALGNVGAGTNNAAIGNAALGGNNGSGNVGLGNDTGPSLTGGSEDILIGDSVDAPSPTSSYFMNIGNLIYATGLYPGSSGGPSNVGIGTDAPLEALDVNGVINAKGNDANGFSGFMWGYDGGVTTTAPLISVGWPGSTAFSNYIKSSGGDNLSLQIGAATDPSATGNIYLSTGTNAFAMSILRNGQVGISAYPPDDDLTIGDANGDGDTEIYLTTTGTSDVTIGATTTGDTWFWNSGASSDMFFGTGNKMALLIDDQQRVGIGTGGVTPALALTVGGAGGAPATTGTAQTGFARFENAGSFGNVLDVGGFTASPYGLWLQAADRGGLSTDYPLVLNPNGGNVGIGTTSPQATLDINGSMRLAKNSSQPVACSSTHDGQIALTHNYTLCICKGGSSSWVQSKDGSTACSW